MPQKQDITRRAMTDRAVREYGGMVLRLARSRIQLINDAEDVFQEVFVSLYTSKTVFSNEDHLRRWLVRATLNHCKNYYRFQSRHPEDPTNPLDRSGPLSEDSGLATVTGALSERWVDPDHELWAAVRELPEKVSTVLVLYYVENYSTAEIATILEINPVTVRTRLAKARKKLKALLREGESGRE